MQIWFTYIPQGFTIWNLVLMVTEIVNYEKIMLALAAHLLKRWGALEALSSLGELPLEGLSLLLCDL